MNIIVPSCSMRSKPDKKSELETQCLYGETLEILDSHQEWFYCKLLTDNYLGWINKKNFDHMISPTHRVIANRTFLFQEKNIKSFYFYYLPLGAQIFVEDYEDNWAKVYLYNKNRKKTAYIPRNHLVKLDHKLLDWVSVAEKLIGTPYLWGGRDTIGLDCSALLQLSYQTYGENIPRNSNKQRLLKKRVVTNIDKLNRGVVIFWKGHVGIMVDKSNCIHANAYHMQTTKEPLFKITNRMGKNNEIIKIMDFN